MSDRILTLKRLVYWSQNGLILVSLFVFSDNPMRLSCNLIWNEVDLLLVAFIFGVDVLCLLKGYEILSLVSLLAIQLNIFVFTSLSKLKQVISSTKLSWIIHSIFPRAWLEALDHAHSCHTFRIHKSTLVSQLEGASIIISNLNHLAIVQSVLFLFLLLILWHFCFKHRLGFIRKVIDIVFWPFGWRIMKQIHPSERITFLFNLMLVARWWLIFWCVEVWS